MSIGVTILGTNREGTGGIIFFSAGEIDRLSAGSGGLWGTLGDSLPKFSVFSDCGVFLSVPFPRNLFSVNKKSTCFEVVFLLGFEQSETLQKSKKVATLTLARLFYLRNNFL